MWRVTRDKHEGGEGEGAEVVVGGAVGGGGGGEELGCTEEGKRGRWKSTRTNKTTRKQKAVENTKNGKSNEELHEGSRRCEREGGTKGER